MKHIFLLKINASVDLSYFLLLYLDIEFVFLFFLFGNRYYFNPYTTVSLYIVSVMMLRQLYKNLTRCLSVNVGLNKLNGGLRA